ncbi:MAG: CobW family GTP-binding protein [Acetobacteraceae bacterium]
MDEIARHVTEGIPVTLITGFLGSGKTTLLTRLLAHPGMDRVAVIINEFGEVGLDHLLVARRVEDVRLLANGCLCCSVRGELVATLADLYARAADGTIPGFDRVIIETTGLADPLPVLQTVVGDAVISRLFRLDGIVTTVDAANADDTLDRHFESVKQVTLADTLLITKGDLVAPDALAALRGRLRRLNPEAELATVAFGEIPPERLLGLSSAPKISAQRAGSPEPAGHEHHEHGPHDAEIQTFSLTFDAPILRSGLRVWIDLLAAFRGSDLLRVKGLLNVEGEPVVVNAVQHLFHPLQTLPTWPTADRRSHFVFITRGIGEATLARTFAAFGFQSGALEPRRFAEFVALASRFR